MTKDIRHLHYSSERLVVTYEDGETREVVYVHLQKRKFPDPTCRGNFYIMRDSFLDENGYTESVNVGGIQEE